MSKLSYKFLLIIFFSLLIAIIVLLKFVLPKKASAAWWNDGWNYRKVLTVTNDIGSAQTNAQVKILANVDLSALVTADKLQSNLNDLRFTDMNGQPIQYWIEDSTNNSVDVWAFIPSLLNGDNAIYMYYGNSSAAAGKVTLGSPQYPGISCRAIQMNGQTTNGRYYIDTDGMQPDNAFPTYCDMAGDGGGWTLMMKADGNNATFDYSANYWTTNNTLNPDQVEISDNGDAKLQSFNVLQINEIRATWPQTGHTMKETVPLNTPLNIFQTTTDLGPSMAQFDYTNFPYQTGYQDYGFNLTCASAKKVRWGWMFNNETTCSSNDCSAGIGMVTTYNASMGGSVTCCSSKANGGYPYAVRIWGRETNLVVPANISSSFTTSEEVGGGPIAYWKLDEGVGATVYDSTLNLHNGVLAPGSSAPTWQTTDKCISGKCLNFDGLTNYIDTNYVYNMSYNTSTTFSFWFKPSNNNTGGYIKDIIAKNNFEFLIGQIDQHLSFQQWNASGTNLISLNSTNFIQANQWYYITVISDNSDHKAKIFINGKADNTSNITNDIFINRPESIKIGRGYGWGSSTTPFFNGLIDDVKIYPYARTAAQIKLDYNSRGSLKGTTANLSTGSTGSPLSSNLVAYYKFDEGNGSTVYNFGNGGTSLNGTFGTGNSAPFWSTDGKYNKSLNFNGSNSYLTMPNSVSLWPAKVSMFAWVYPKAAANGTDYVIKDDNSYFLLLTGDGSQLTVQTNLYISGGWRGRWISTSKINPNTWSYVGFTYDGTNINLYINGVLSGSYIPSPTGDLNTGALGNLIIGKRGGGSFFNGLIDEVKIYNIALTPDQVKQDYNHGSATNFGSTNQTIGGTTTDLNYCIPGDTSACSTPIAEWKMDEGSGSNIKDTSGNNNIGTISGATWTQGKIGTGLNFNGNDYIDLGSLSDSSTSHTFEYWIKSTASTTNLTMLTDSQTGRLITAWVGNNPGKLGYFDGVWRDTNVNAPNDGKWHHLSFVFNGSNSTGTIYIDGIGQTTMSYTPITMGGQTVLGSRYSKDSYFFTGSMDQVKFYNYARTPAQIAYDYNKGGPVGWWKFDECQGNTAYDWSGNSNNGAINIGASGTQTSVGNCSDNLSTSAWNNGKIGKINSSLNFDGIDDKVSVNPVANFSYYQNPRSIAVWAKLTTSPSHYNTLLAYGTAGTGQANGLTISTSSKVVFFGYGSQDLSSNTTLTINKWYHIVATYDGVNTKIYVNGSFDNSGTATWNTTPNIFYIGEQVNNGNEYFQGQMDDVRVYNYALTAEQVKQIYNGGAINFN